MSLQHLLGTPNLDKANKCVHTERINKLGQLLIKRFENLVELAAVSFCVGFSDSLLSSARISKPKGYTVRTLRTFQIAGGSDGLWLVANNLACRSLIPTAMPRR